MWGATDPMTGSPPESIIILIIPERTVDEAIGRCYLGEAGMI
jgi:hypothetical protein